MNAIFVTLLGVILGSGWVALAVVARLDDAIYLPLGVRTAVGAAVIGILGLLTTGRFPKLSLKVFQPAVTIGLLAYFLSPLLAFHSLRVLPSGLVGLAFSVVPLAVAYVTLDESRPGVAWGAIVLAGLGAFYFGVREEAGLRGAPDAHFAFLLGAVVCFVMAIWVARKILWLHASLELNFWSMVIGAVVFFIVGLISGESPSLLASWGESYYLYLLYGGLVVAGVLSHLYRFTGFKTKATGRFCLTIVAPITSLTLGIVLWGETSLNLFTVGATAVVAAALGVVALGVPSRHWLSHFLYNDIRKEDRISCEIQGFLKPQKGSVGKIVVVDISLGGLGFLSDIQYRVPDDVIVTIPLGLNWSQVALECKIAHVRPTGRKDFPWAGGLQFQSIEREDRQNIVEFIARLSKHSEIMVDASGF